MRLPHLQIKPSGRLAVLLDHVEGAVGKIIAVMDALRLELARQEGLLLLGAPRHRRQFLLAGRSIEAHQEGEIGVGLRPQREALRQQRRRQSERRRRLFEFTTTFRSASRREDAVEADAEIEHLERRHIVVRHAAAGHRDGLRGELRRRRWGSARASRRLDVGRDNSWRLGSRFFPTRARVAAVDFMRMLRDLQACQRHSGWPWTCPMTVVEGPVPQCIGIWPCRLGSAKLVVPLPP